MRYSRLTRLVTVFGVLAALAACGTGPSDPIPGEENEMSPAATAAMDSLRAS